MLAIHAQIPTGAELMMIASCPCIVLAHHAGGGAYVDVATRTRLFRCERVVQRFRHAVGAFGLQAVAFMIAYFFHRLNQFLIVPESKVRQTNPLFEGQKLPI